MCVHVCVCFDATKLMNKKKPIMMTMKTETMQTMQMTMRRRTTSKVALSFTSTTWFVVVILLMAMTTLPIVTLAQSLCAAVDTAAVLVKIKNNMVSSEYLFPLQEIAVDDHCVVCCIVMLCANPRMQNTWMYICKQYVKYKFICCLSSDSHAYTILHLPYTGLAGVTARQQPQQQPHCGQIIFGRSAMCLRSTSSASTRKPGKL